MKLWRKAGQKKEGVSTTRLLLGAAGLLLFIVGLKRTYRPDKGSETAREDLVADAAPDAPTLVPPARAGHGPEAPAGS